MNNVFITTIFPRDSVPALTFLTKFYKIKIYQREEYRNKTSGLKNDEKKTI